MVKESTKETKNQHDRLKDAAREHGCDEDEKAFDVKFGSGPLAHLEFSVCCSGWEGAC
jgi:DNA invertase Pin-like site-specific DNA recombinase